MQRQKIRVGKQVCTHHRENIAVWRGLGDFFLVFGCWWDGDHTRGTRGEWVWGWAGGKGWGVGICNTGRLHLCLCVFYEQGLNLQYCAVGVWAAENFGSLNTAKAEKYGSSFANL